MINKLMAAFLLIASVCTAQTIASRRHAELKPEQYVFGPLTAVAPFNAVPNRTTVATTTQLQPSGLIQSNNAFTSSANFDVIQQTSPATTFSVASNVGTITSTANGVYLLGDPATSFAAPTAFIQVEVVANGNSGSEFGLVLSNSTGSTYVMADMYHASQCTVVVFTGGSYHNIVTPSCALPSTPWRMGLSLVGNDACFWMNAGSGWQVEGCGSTASYYNFQTSGNLSGFQAAMRVVSGSSTPWEVSNLVTGGFGAVGVRDIALVTYADGRPYMLGSVAYFTATSCDPNAGCYDGLYTYDVVAETLTEIGAIFNSRGGIIAADEASHLIYDPGISGYRYLVGGFNGGEAAGPTYYGSWSRSSLDPLAGGVSVITASTAMSWTFGSTSWDAHMACADWNYSASTCGKWIVGLASGIQSQEAQSTTSDPGANSWSAIGQIATNYSEGDRILRTATGSGGVLYEIGYVDALSGGISTRENTIWQTASVSSFSPAGELTGQVPGGPVNPPHPQIFSYGNSEYLVTFDNALWGTNANTMGNWLVATAPKYSAQPNYPQFATGTDSFSGGSAASITSSAISVTSGDLIVVFCRGANTSATSVAAGSSVSMGTFSSPGFNLISSGSGTGYDQAFYLFATAAGSSTFSCTPNAASADQGVTVMDFHPAFLTTADYTAIGNQIGSSSALYTSPSFSTTAKGLVVVCTDGLFGGGQFIPGFIGPYAAGPANGVASGAAACMSTVTPAAQSSITATMGYNSGSGGQWGGAILSFK